MLHSIYDDQYECPKIEHEVPREVEEMYVAKHGIEPSVRKLLIMPKFGKK